MAFKKSQSYLKSTYDGDSEEETMGLRQALPVPPIPDDFDPDRPPTTGEEYLQQVMHQAKNLPRVVTALRTGISKSKSYCDPHMCPVKPSLIPSKLAPNKHWEDLQVAKFEKLRHNIHNWRMNCLGNKKSSLPDTHAHPSTWMFALSNTQPLLSEVLPLHQEQLEKILSILLLVQPGDPLWESYGSWLYAVCACLEHPLSREAYGELRDIARKCSQIRNTKEDANDREVTMLNLVIVLVVKYFRQYDLCEPG